MFPLLSANQNPQLELRAYDYSSHAVKLVQVTLCSGFAGSFIDKPPRTTRYTYRLQLALSKPLSGI